MDADITAFTHIYFFGEQKIGELKGNLKIGIEINVGVRVASGTIRLYEESGYIWSQYNLVIFGIVEKGTHKLFELP